MDADSSLEPEHDAILADLETFIIANPALERLESLLGPFNVFEAIGVEQRELDHSNFLAFLLNPHQNHGLADSFLKRFLQAAIAPTAPVPLPMSRLQLELADLEDTEVRREWQNIDILLLNRSHQLAVIIENKILSGEHSDQLRRYREIIQQHYPDWRVLCLFLTPQGTAPSDSGYLPISYATVCHLVAQLVSGDCVTNIAVRTVLDHYAQMLRRQVLDEPQIAELCREIYRKHSRALERIFRYRPDRQQQIADYLQTLIDQEDRLGRDHCTKTAIRFYVREWDETNALREGETWTPTGRILLFEFTNQPAGLSLGLWIGPGPDATFGVRQALLDVATSNIPPFKPARRQLNKQWNSIFSRRFLGRDAYDEEDSEGLLEGEILQRWTAFVKSDLPQICEKIREGLAAFQKSAGTESQAAVPKPLP